MSRVSLVGLCELLRNIRLHVQNAHCAPFLGAQKHDRKRDMLKKWENCTGGAPGERWGCAIELQVRCSEPTRRTSWRQRPSQRSKVAPWLCPSVLEAALWMLYLRNLSSDPKLQSASEDARKGAGSSKGAQARSKAGLKGCQGLP